MNKSNWMSSNAAGLAERKVGYDNSTRIESKRGHQWFMDANEPEFFGNKKQALEGVNTGSLPGISNLNVSLWENTSSSPSASRPFTDRLFGSEPIRDVSNLGQNVPPTGNMNISRKSFENLFGSDSKVGLSMSHTIEEPESCADYGGIRKVRVNQVRNPENGMSVSIGGAYNGADDSSNSIEAPYDRDDSNTMSLGLTYNNRVNNAISIGPSFCKEHETFISMGHTFNKADGNFISIGRTGHTYNKGAENMLTMALPFEKADGSFISMGQPYVKNGNNMIAASQTHSYNKGLGDFFPIGSSYSQDNENIISMGGLTYNKVANNIVSVGETYDKKNENSVLVGLSTYEKRDSNILSMGHNYSKGEGHSISFGDFQDDPETNHTGKDIGNYDLVMTQSSSHPLVAFAQKNLVQSNVGSAVRSAPVVASRNDNAPKHKNLKTSKKVPANNFPSNVKSLLSTGMLDGVTVKYVSWSREKNLRGVIKGTGYLCGCNDCNLINVLNAYEFERHAGCKTKHPNNHIYFENGKTIYAVVQELKSTHQELLFDAIQNITGSPINQKNFRIWKESYQAATRELQRIYGKEEVIMPS